jgi:tripartite-type tricarboxylate transporter receptor subunit TctC
MFFVASLSAQTQGYPNKPVKILVGYAAGSSTDIAGRLMGQALSELWKQPVVVENRGGAAGNLAADAVAKSAGDGYTLLLAQNGLAISTAANPKLPFNGEKDLLPVAAVAATPHILIVPNSSPAKSVQDLIDMAKKSKLRRTLAQAALVIPTTWQQSYLKWSQACPSVYLNHKRAEYAL